ncbi:MAG: GNAT family N-acetyltransferase [Rhizobacter sp.]|nr:GNAT family N-acetyltransferase [Rhizobacter sp.]
MQMPHPPTSSTPPPALVPTDAVAPAELHAAFGLAFADYVAGPFQLALAQWPAFLARQGVDLTLGRAALRDGRVVAFALTAPRPARRRWRLATMGAVPEARGSGAAAGLLHDLLQRARAEGQQAVELEVFARNEAAVRLYRRFGFEVRHPLYGYELTASDDAPSAQGEPPPSCTPHDALAWLEAAERQLDDLPLQVSAAAVAALPAGWQAWRQGTAQLVFSRADDGALLVRSLVDLDPAQHAAHALLRRLCAAHPGARVTVPQLQRPDLGGEALQRAGFRALELHQWLMRVEL